MQVNKRHDFLTFDPDPQFHNIMEIRKAFSMSVNAGAEPPSGTVVWHRLAQLPSEAAEIRITIPRDQAARKRFGFRLFGDGKTGGLPIILRPETGTIRVGTTEAPFAVADLPAGEDVELRIFVDKYLVEVFANGRQALAAWQRETGDNFDPQGIKPDGVDRETFKKRERKKSAKENGEES